MSDARTQQDWYRSAPWIDSESADIDAYVDTVDRSPGYDLKQKLVDWHSNGVILFENVVDRDLIDRVNADIALVLANHRKYHIYVDGSDDVFEKYQFLDRLSDEQLKGYNVRLVDIHNKSFNACLLAMVPEATSFLRHVFGSPPVLLQSLTFSRGSEQALHQDFPYVFQQREIAKLAAFWIPLEDIHPDSGPLVYYPGTHQVSRMGFFDWGEGHINNFDRFSAKEKVDEYGRYLEAKVASMGFAPLRYLPKKGDVLIWHGALVHGGSKIGNRKLTRKSFVGHFTSLENHHSLARNRFNEAFVLDVPSKSDIRAYATGQSGAAAPSHRSIKQVYWDLRKRLARPPSR